VKIAEGAGALEETVVRFRCSARAVHEHPAPRHQRDRRAEALGRRADARRAARAAG